MVIGYFEKGKMGDSNGDTDMTTEKEQRMEGKEACKAELNKSGGRRRRDEGRRLMLHCLQHFS